MDQNGPAVLGLNCLHLHWKRPGGEPRRKSTASKGEVATLSPATLSVGHRSNHLLSHCEERRFARRGLLES